MSSSWIKNIYKFFRRGQTDIVATRDDCNADEKKNKYRPIRGRSYKLLQNEHGSETRSKEIGLDSVASPIPSTNQEPSLNYCQLETKQGNDISSPKNSKDTTTLEMDALQKNGMPDETPRKVCRFVLVIPTWIHSDLEDPMEENMVETQDNCENALDELSID